MSRSQRRARRRARRRALGVLVAAAAVTLGAVVPLTFAAAGGDGTQGRPPDWAARPAAEPSLVAASDELRARDEERLARAVLDHAVLASAVFERAVAEKATRESIWDRIAACETQGDWSMRGSSYSGGVGFSNAAWNQWGGREFAPNAGQATREQQIIVAERIRAAVGLDAWGCAKTLGLTR